eukprot:2681117-Prymnesium_polylepis.1
MPPGPAPLLTAHPPEQQAATGRGGGFSRARRAGGAWRAWGRCVAAATRVGAAHHARWRVAGNRGDTGDARA